MKPLFDITVLGIPTRTAHEWLKRFSEFLSEEIKEGAWIRGWPELNVWLLNAFRVTPSAMKMSHSRIDRLERTARILGRDVVEQLFERGMTHLYRVNEPEELRAFSLTSWDNDNYALVLFPANCSHEDEVLILSTADNLGITYYPTLDVSAPWFVTMNIEGTDDSFVCFASKDSDRAESLRRNFSDYVYPLDEFVKNYVEEP